MRIVVEVNVVNVSIRGFNCAREEKKFTVKSIYYANGIFSAVICTQ